MNINQFQNLESHYTVFILISAGTGSFFDFTLVFIGRLELEGTLSDQIGNVELFDERRKCKIDNLPMDISDAAVVDNIICGGKIETPKLEVTNACIQLLRNGSWVFTHPMKERRYMFTMTKIGSDIIAIGGINYGGKIKVLSTIEKLNSTGWYQLSDAPVPMARHCTMMINSTFLLITGGVPMQFVEVQSSY